MKTIKFNCNGHNAPAYGCSESGDQSGEYVRVEDLSGIEDRVTHIEQACFNLWLDHSREDIEKHAPSVRTLWKVGKNISKRGKE